MKVQLDIKGGRDPAKNSVIVWNGECWEAITKEEFLAGLAKAQRGFEEKTSKELDAINRRINVLAKAIGGKQK